MSPRLAPAQAAAGSSCVVARDETPRPGLSEAISLRMPLVSPAAVQLNCAAWTVMPSPLLPPPSSAVQPATAPVRRAATATAEARWRVFERSMDLLSWQGRARGPVVGD